MPELLNVALIVPSSNTVMEPDFHRHLGCECVVGTTRIFLEEVTREAEVRMLADGLPKAVELVRTAQPDVVVFGCTGSHLPRLSLLWSRKSQGVAPTVLFFPVQTGMPSRRSNRFRGSWGYPSSPVTRLPFIWFGKRLPNVFRRWRENVHVRSSRKRNRHGRCRVEDHE